MCDEKDKYSLSSLNQAKLSFDDAFQALQVVENSAFYKEADKTYPHHKDYRTCNLPRDAFHVACNGHKTRLQNILRFSGVDPIEKALVEQRLDNLITAKNSYIIKQKKALKEVSSE